MTVSYRTRALLAILTLCFILRSTFANDETEQRRRARAAQKPWFNQSLRLGDTNLIVTPISLFVAFVSIFYLLYNWGGGSKEYCEASHILIMDHTEATKEKLLEYQNIIGKDPALFAKHAKKYSACPSKQQGGNLGKFKRYAMAPPFDKVCFDPDTPLQTTVGPVHTTFGWHLIYIHSREC